MATYSPQSFIIPYTDMAISLSEVHQAHAYMVKTGLIRSTFAASRIIAHAANTPSVDPPAISYAHSVFAHIASPNAYTWTAMIRAYANSSSPEHALNLFHQMLHSPTPPDKFTFPFAIKACSQLCAFEEGRQIHAQSVKTGLCSDLFIGNTLVHMYASLGHTTQARCLIDGMHHSNVISWNAIVSGCIKCGSIEEARGLFDGMPDRNAGSWNLMVTAYVDQGLIEEARELFDEMPSRDVVSWNAMITGYMHASRFNEALRLFEDMQLAKVKPDSFSLMNVLSARARVRALSQGK